MGCCPLTPCQVDDLLYEVTEVSTANHFSQKKVNTWPFLHIYPPPHPTHPSNNVYGGEVYWNHSVCLFIIQTIPFEV